MRGGQLLLTLAVATTILLVLETCRILIVRYLVRKLASQETVEVRFLAPLSMNFVFGVLLPTIVYAATYPILPFTSYRSGFFIALFVFGVGVLPQHVRSYNQYRLPTVLTVFELFWSLLTLLLLLGSITYVYR